MLSLSPSVVIIFFPSPHLSFPSSLSHILAQKRKSLACHLMNLPPVVLDNGTGSIKCGCAGVSPLPLFVCPTVVGHPFREAVKLPSLLKCTSEGSPSSRGVLGGDPSARGCTESEHSEQLLRRDVLCGDELAGRRGDAHLTFPIRNGVIQDMAAMQDLWDYVLCRRLPSLLSGAAQHSERHYNHDGEDENEKEDGSAWLVNRPLLLTEPPNISLKQRCDQVEVFFETYRLGALQSAPQGVLSLFANGTESGVVVECGEGLSHCTPVFDGCVLTTAQRRLDFGGEVVTQYLSQLLRESHGADGFVHASASRAAPVATAHDAAGMDVVRRLKERYCYVAAEHHVDARLARETSALCRTCTLPDGALCRLNTERFTAPEVLFSPAVMHIESPGISAVLWDCIEAAEVDVRRALYENIILSGGTTLLAGFGARLATDMKAAYLREKLKGDLSRMARCPIAVKEPPRRQYMAYVGGALMAELTAGQTEAWLSRGEYEEGGVGAVVARYHKLS